MENLNTSPNANNQTTNSEHSIDVNGTPVAVPTVEELIREAKPAPTVAELMKELENEREGRRADKAAHDKRITEIRLEHAAEQAKGTVHADVGTAGQEAIAFEKAVKACGGRAYWEKLTPTQKAAALGVEGSEQVPDKEICRFVGPKSDARAANALMASNPALYRRYKRLAQSRNLI